MDIARSRARKANEEVTPGEQSKHQGELGEGVELFVGLKLALVI